MESKKKYQLSTIIGLLLVLSVSGTLYISDYRAILSEVSDEQLVLLDYAPSFNRLELITKLAPEGVEFTRFLYRDDYMKVYYGRDLVAKSSWQVFQGSKQVVYNDILPIEWTRDSNDHVTIIMKKHFFADSRHKTSIGVLERRIEVIPDTNKETITWTPDNESIKYGLRWSTQTDYEAQGADFKKLGVTSTEEFPIISWSDSIELSSASRRYNNGIVRVFYSTKAGMQVIDPAIISAKNTLADGDRGGGRKDNPVSSKSNNLTYELCNNNIHTEFTDRGTTKVVVGGEPYEIVNNECVPSVSLVSVVAHDNGTITASYKEDSISIIPLYDDGTKKELVDLKTVNKTITSRVDFTEKKYGKQFSQTITGIEKSKIDRISRTGYRVVGSGDYKIDDNNIYFSDGLGVDFTDFIKEQNVTFEGNEIFVNEYRSDLDPTIIFTTPDSQNLDDTYFYVGGNGADDDRGTSTLLYIVNQTGGPSTANRKVAIKFNISALLGAGITRNNLINATLVLDGTGSGMDSGDTYVVTVQEIYQYPTYTPGSGSAEWNEGNANSVSGCVAPELCGNSQPNITTEYNGTVESSKFITSVTDTQDHYFSVIEMVGRTFDDGYHNISMLVSATDPQGSITGSDSLRFGSKEDSTPGDRPFLEIEYNSSTAPTHDDPTITPDPAITNDDLTANNISTADIDTGAVDNIYDWRLATQSIALVNIPIYGGEPFLTFNDYSSFSPTFKLNNTVENGGFETGATTDWTALAGAFTCDLASGAILAAITESPYEGTYNLNISTDVKYSGIRYTTSSETIVSGATYRVSFYVQAENNTAIYLKQGSACGAMTSITVSATTGWEYKQFIATTSSTTDLTMIIRSLADTPTQNRVQIDNLVVSRINPLNTTGYDGSGALEFDGVDDHVLIANADTDFSNKNMTIEAWVKVNTHSSSKGIVTQSTADSANPYFCFSLDKIFYSGDVVPKFRTGFSNGTSGEYKNVNSVKNYTLGAWHHLAGTFNGTHVSLYMDGEFQDARTMTGSICNEGTDTKIGQSGTSSNYFNGSIDEIKLYDRALSPEQIYQHYLNQSSILVSEETILGESWTVAVTPNDGTQNGITKVSSAIVITAVASSCNPTASQDWNITDSQVCNGATVSLPNNNIILSPGGSLVCKGGSMITTKGFLTRYCNGDCSIHGDSLTGCTITELGQ